MTPRQQIVEQTLCALNQHNTTPGTTWYADTTGAYQHQPEHGMLDHLQFVQLIDGMPRPTFLQEPPDTQQTPEAPTPRTDRPSSRPWPGPCPCPCNNGGFCGGCGHAGCGGRRRT